MNTLKNIKQLRMEFYKSVSEMQSLKSFFFQIILPGLMGIFKGYTIYSVLGTVIKLYSFFSP